MGQVRNLIPTEEEALFTFDEEGLAALRVARDIFQADPVVRSRRLRHQLRVSSYHLSDTVERLRQGALALQSVITPITVMVPRNAGTDKDTGSCAQPPPMLRLA